MSALERAKYAYEKLKTKRRAGGNHGRLRSQVVREYVLTKLIEEHWSPEEIAGRILIDIPGESIAPQTIYNFIRYERSDLRRFLVDLRERFTVETARTALQTVVHPSGEISGFVGWNGHPQISVMSEAARAAANKGIRVIPDGELMAFSDDIELISKAIDALGGSSSAGPPDYAEAPSSK
jgi:hypothetical protein